MKIKFNGTKYCRYDGLMFNVPGEYEVDEETAEYLLNTYPNLFSEVKKNIKEEIKETKLKRKSRKK